MEPHESKKLANCEILLSEIRDLLKAIAAREADRIAEGETEDTESQRTLAKDRLAALLAYYFKISTAELCAHVANVVVHDEAFLTAIRALRKPLPPQQEET